MQTRARQHWEGCPLPCGVMLTASSSAVLMGFVKKAVYRPGTKLATHPAVCWSPLCSSEPSSRDLERP